MVAAGGKLTNRGIGNAKWRPLLSAEYARARLESQALDLQGGETPSRCSKPKNRGWVMGSLLRGLVMGKRSSFCAGALQRNGPSSGGLD